MQIPGYRIERLIGRGGMAAVYLAIQESLERPVALKVLDDSVALMPQFTQRFLSEGRIIAALQHRNIITIHDIGVAGSAHYISMEYVDGGDLKRRIAGGVDTETALDLVETIGTCLHFTHQAGVVHRDVTPANILFRKDGTPLLTDFGIAKRLRAESELTAATGTVLGTPSYLSPERTQGDAIDGRTDIYSLGVILYEMLVGKKPYTGDTDLDVILKHLQEPIPTLPRHLSRFQPLLEGMLAKRPEDRFADAETMVGHVRDLRRTGGSPRRAVRGPSGGSRGGSRGVRHGGLWAGLAAALVVAAIGGSWAAGLWRPDAIPWWFSAAPSVDARDTGGAHLPSREVAGLDDTSAPTAAGAPARRSGRAPGDASERLLALANDAFASGRLAAPPGDNASYYYREALKRNPDDPRAKAGLRRIAKAYTRMAERKLAAGSYAQAKRYVELGLDASPGAPELLALDEELGRLLQVERLLARGDEALGDYRLTTPPGDNAFHYYRRVLELDATNRRAEHGLEKIARRYARLAEGQIAQYNYTKAREYIERGLAVQPGDERLLALKQEAHFTNAPKHLLENLKGLFR